MGRACKLAADTGHADNQHLVFAQNQKFKMSASDTFDPYRKWLGIPTADQPPHHYRLLGVGLFEDDADTIAIAADRQMAHLRTFQTGPHSALSQKLLNELAAARIALLDAKKKAAYDQQLRAKLAESTAQGDVTAQGDAAGHAKEVMPPATPMPIARPVPVPVTPQPPATSAQAEYGKAGDPVDPLTLAMPREVTIAASRRGRKNRSRPDAMLWVGVAVAAAALAAVVYVAREQSKPSPDTAKTVAQADVSSKAPDALQPVSEGDTSDSHRSSDDPPREPALTISNDEPPAEAAAMQPPADGTSENDKPPADSKPENAKPPQGNTTEVTPPAPEKRTSLDELFSRGDRLRIDSPRRDAPPEGRALAAANARFAELYGKNVAKARTPEAFRKQAFRGLHLAQEGVETSDIRYLLLGRSGFLAAGQGNVGLAYRVAVEVTRQFDVDPYSHKLNALEVTGKNATTPAANAIGALQALTLAQRAAAEGKSDVASKAAGQAVLFARKTKDKDIMDLVNQTKAALREQSSRGAAYQKALGLLKKTPESVEANLVAGKYEVLVLGEWSAGLRKFAACGEPGWLAIAEGEALARDDFSRWAPLAGAWWQMAAGEQDEYFHLQCRLQAKYCYLRARQTGRGTEVPGEIAEQLKRLEGYPLSRLRPGIAARYYEGERFGRQRVERIDPAIDFFYGPGSPDPVVPNDHFSARWTGFFKPPMKGRYLIATHTDDGIRLSVDGRQVLDRWVRAAGWQQVELDLTPELHTIQMEYHEQFAPAWAMLGWTLAAFPDPDHTQFSPIDALYHDPQSPFDLPELP